MKISQLYVSSAYLHITRVSDCGNVFGLLIPDVFEDYVVENHKDELLGIMQDTEAGKHYSIGIK